MADTPTPARRAVVALARDGECVEVGPVASGPCDAAFVEDLLRFDLAARRLGWRLRLREVDPDLHELLDLVGVADRVDR
jgi:hypothetical protein